MVTRSVKRDWVLTEDGFNRLLEALDSDRNTAADRYEHLRRSLVRYFDWRGSINSERDTDETIDRIARKLSDGQTIEEIHSYALGVARYVHLESLRRQQTEQALLDRPLIDDAKPDNHLDRRVECFETCLGKLPGDKRELILAYYEGDKQTKIVNRQKLAEKSGLPIGRLRIQAHRIREKLEECIEQCLSSGTAGDD